jgi:hypothetical protein
MMTQSNVIGLKRISDMAERRDGNMPNEPGLDCWHKKPRRFVAACYRRRFFEFVFSHAA